MRGMGSNENWVFSCLNTQFVGKIIGAILNHLFGYHPLRELFVGEE